LPSVNKLHSEFKARGFEAVLINFREDPALVKRTARERGYVAPVLLDQSGDVTGKGYGVWGPPTSYLVDARGQLIGRIAGARAWSGPAARRLVESLLPGSSTR
jgi:hypothetical protein